MNVRCFCMLESETIECKAIINNDFKKEIIAFANTNGGIIYVGIADDGTVIGIEDIEKEMEKISHMIHDSIRPDLIPYTKIEKESIDHRDVIKITVLRGDKRPYHIRDKGLKSSGVYVCHGVSSQPASEGAIREMVKESDGIVFDKARSLDQELTFSYFEYICKEKDLSLTKESMRTLKLVNADGYYTNAAFLLSDQCSYTIKVAVFQGNTKLVFKARKEFSGSILKQVEDVITFLDMHSNENTEITGLARIDQPDYPKAAIRETVLNAVVHRDYTYSGSVLINIFDNRMEVISLGSLVKGLQYEDIMSGVSQTRNEGIASIFYRLHYIESYGTGISRIMEVYKQAKVQPSITLNPSSFILVLPKFEKADGKIANSREELVFRRIEEYGQITRKDVEKILSCSSFTANRILHHLLERNLIQPNGAARSTYYTKK